MSKSMGNVLSPQKIMQTMGADILRLWVAASFLPTITDTILILEDHFSMIFPMLPE